MSGVLAVRCRRSGHRLATVVHDDDGWWLEVTRFAAYRENRWAGTPLRLRLPAPGRSGRVYDATWIGCACGTGKLQPHQEILDALERGDTLIIAY